ncbi:alpha/beta fold hydrolase [Rhodococcus sp. BGS-1C]|jgi:predicted alpha/beta hydrolase|uniref:alpha/beta hydrolase family protein n=1 Tax=Nocardiaceae TaxID=85025 RepID=UPI000966CEAB|nr:MULTISPECIES: alpha/beta fold hydrolase [Rhodococcus]MCZ4276773.1 alpha/beta fold hydrolase [Rhodococcus yunnanensis]OLT37575.1 alpha/beta hydrolase [Rhodococcus sp. CUA-806]
MSATSGTRRPSEYSSLEALPVTVSGDISFTVRILRAVDPSAPVVLILPAMVMKAKHYMHLAKAFHGQGFSVALCDLRGQGESKPPLLEQPNFGYREMIETDLPAITAVIRETFVDSDIHLFGHSLGGQLALLYSAAEPGAVDSVTVIGTGTVYWRAFGMRRWFEALRDIQWIGLVARFKGHWPGGVLIPGAMAGRVMVDWSRHSLTSRYRPAGSSRNYDRLLAAMTTPVFAISLEEDLLGPKSNVDFLESRMTSSPVTRWHIDGDSPVTHRDHFEWIKDSGAIAAVASDWIRTGDYVA